MDRPSIAAAFLLALAAGACPPAVAGARPAHVPSGTAAEAASADTPASARKLAGVSQRRLRQSSSKAPSQRAVRPAPSTAVAAPSPAPGSAAAHGVAPSLIERIEALWSPSTSAAHRHAWLPTQVHLHAANMSAPVAADDSWAAALREGPGWVDWVFQVQAWQDPAQTLPLGLRPRLSQEPESAVLRSHRLERDVALSGRLLPQIKLGLNVRF